MFRNRLTFLNTCGGLNVRGRICCDVWEFVRFESARTARKLHRAAARRWSLIVAGEDLEASVEAQFVERRVEAHPMSWALKIWSVVLLEAGMLKEVYVVLIIAKGVFGASCPGSARHVESPPPGHHNLNSTIAGVLTSTHCSYSNEGCLFQCIPRNAFWFQLISAIHGKLSVLGDLQRNVSPTSTILPLEMFYAFHHTKPRHSSCATLPGPSIRSVPWLHPRYFRRGPGRPPVRQTSSSPGNHDLHSWYMPGQQMDHG